MKNNKIMKIFSIFALVTAFAACSNQAPDSDKESTSSVESTSSENIEMNEQSMENSEMSTESTDPQAGKEEALEEGESQVQNKDGVYVATLLASNEGEPIADIDTATCYEIAIEDNKFLLKGGLDYRQTFEDYDNITPIENGIHEFELADDVVFQAVGGTAPAKIIEKDKFVDYEKELDNSGLALIIEVENGLVKTVSISS